MPYFLFLCVARDLPREKKQLPLQMQEGWKTKKKTETP
jgi:hypothetical protein